MNSYDACKAIVELDLDPIKVKLMHRQSGEGWTLARSSAVELEYRRFLFLRKAFPSEAITPLEDVDTFWHYHILDTMKYAADCRVIFGHFLHHFPYSGMRGEEDLANHKRLGDRTRDLYGQAFGEDYYAKAIACREPELATAFCNIASPTASSADRAAAAFCNVATATAAPADGSATAFCNTATTPVARADGTATAFCNIATAPAARADGAATAFCNIATASEAPASDAATAFCNMAAAPTACSDGAATAFCNIATAPAARAERAATAFCNIATASAARADGAAIAFCNLGTAPAFCNTGTITDQGSKKRTGLFQALPA